MARGGADAPEAGLDQGALALAWLDLEPQPHLVCTRALELVWANEAGRAALAAGDDLRLSDGIIVARAQVHQQALAAFVKGCEAVLSTLALPAADGDGHLLLRGRQIGGVDRIGLTFLRTTSFRALHADVERAFRLTPSEYRVLLRMIDGHTAEEIAGATRLSIETVRSHIRHIYAKMGVASREAMFAKTLPFRL
ncbi:LuxR C-terminal-related transcriptional regulator [Sphingosinicella sp. LHD-64]|uniref:helix-turn-helix transcriptional regulator n=1 Tax=Sphingosinicella sp. LHD-64 TaxID=3072139 RepID=UPI00280E2CD6|nr:LuxR C-terminal-related transcriptional regulator [Sphingosinicella sp. LHD-64]MDQ8757999.1 LuxR C-terminal-related transcriptional regulator [Sphingosinicella sp. LHD-64]